MKTFKIGTFKNGQQIAKEVFASENLNEIEIEFRRMFASTVEEEWESAVEQNWPENTLDGTTADDAWNYKRFSEDTNNVAVFEVEEGEALHTNWTYQGCTSKMLLK